LVLNIYKMSDKFLVEDNSYEDDDGVSIQVMHHPSICKRYKGYFIAFGIILVIALIIMFAGVSYYNMKSDQPSIQNAPDTFQMSIQTTNSQGDGKIVIEISRSLAPYGVERVYELLTLNQTSYYNDNAFFRISEMGVYFGINGNPSVSAYWSTTIEDDIVATPNVEGMVSLAAGVMENSRSTILFINLQTNEALDSQEFAPIGRVIQGMDVVSNLYSGYGEQIDEEDIYTYGNPYLQAYFPNLDYTTTTEMVLV